jgi:hypothetical protein
VFNDRARGDRQTTLHSLKLSKAHSQAGEILSSAFVQFTCDAPPFLIL